MAARVDDADRSGSLEGPMTAAIAAASGFGGGAVPCPHARPDTA